MNYCNNCGGQIQANDSFCGHCGAKQDMTLSHCTKCGNTIEPDEKFCSECGTQVNKSTVKKQIPKENVNIKRPSPGKKKKNGCLRIFFKVVLILVLLVAALITIFYYVGDWEDDKNTEQKAGKLDADNIPGIVDIEEGDVSHLPENRNRDRNRSQDDTQPLDYRTQEFEETRAMKEACKSVEDAFASADIHQLKNLLSEQSKLNYANLPDDIQPHMKSYAEAFKNRKLALKTDMYALYEFTDKKGQKYTVEFALNEKGEWELTRF